MRVLRGIILLLFMATLAFGQASHRGQAGLSRQPETLVRILYQKALVFHPIGNLWNVKRAVFAPYLSKGLLRRMELEIACEKDLLRQYPDPNLKPPFGEQGTFSGGDEEGSLRSFSVEGARRENDGSVRVKVKLNWGKPPDRPWITHVEAVVVKEGSRFVVDDVIYLSEDGDSARNGSLSRTLAFGCDAGKWVGER